MQMTLHGTRTTLDRGQSTVNGFVTAHVRNPASDVRLPGCVTAYQTPVVSTTPGGPGRGTP
jgi:hypothetical protein